MQEFCSVVSCHICSTAAATFQSCAQWKKGLQCVAAPFQARGGDDSLSRLSHDVPRLLHSLRLLDKLVIGVAELRLRRLMRERPLRTPNGTLLLTSRSVFVHRACAPSSRPPAPQHALPPPSSRDERATFHFVPHTIPDANDTNLAHLKLNDILMHLRDVRSQNKKRGAQKGLECPCLRMFEEGERNSSATRSCAWSWRASDWTSQSGECF